MYNFQTSLKAGVSGWSSLRGINSTYGAVLAIFRGDRITSVQEGGIAEMRHDKPVA